MEHIPWHDADTTVEPWSFSFKKNKTMYAHAMLFLKKNIIYAHESKWICPYVLTTGM